jgi:hypothetical protein
MDPRPEVFACTSVRKGAFKGEESERQFCGDPCCTTITSHTIRIVTAHQQSGQRDRDVVSLEKMQRGDDARGSGMSYPTIL